MLIVFFEREDVCRRQFCRCIIGVSGVPRGPYCMCKTKMAACALRIKCCVLESCCSFDGSFPSRSTTQWSKTIWWPQQFVQTPSPRKKVICIPNQKLSKNDYKLKRGTKALTPFACKFQLATSYLKLQGHFGGSLLMSVRLFFEVQCQLYPSIIYVFSVKPPVSSEQYPVLQNKRSKFYTLLLPQVVSSCQMKVLSLVDYTCC